MTEELTGFLKSESGRERPDASDTRSFPSGHASAAFTYASQTSYNIDAMGLPRPAARGMKIGFRTLAAGSAWARVEGGKHYPSDVLFSAALSNFLTVFINEALLPRDSEMSIGLGLDPDELQITWGWKF